MLKKFYRFLAVLLIGFAGGALCPWVLGWINSSAVSNPSDAVSIANTYIVFTTLIFVGVTVILAVAGYVFTQQFTESKKAQASEIYEELRGRIKTEEKIGIDLASAILENTDASRHVDDLISNKIDALIEERKADSERARKAVEEIAGQIGSNGVKENDSNN